MEFFTLTHGKVVAVAKGAKRPSSHFRGILTPFSPLKVSFSGQNEVKNLTKAQWMGGFFPIEGEALFSAFYVNELLVRLLAREDPLEGLFGSYVEVLKNLTQTEQSHEIALRTFELDLISALGYGLPECSEPWYWDGEELKPLAQRPFDNDRDIVLSVDMIERLRSRDFSDVNTLVFAKKLLRTMIAHYVGEKPLNTRRILQEHKRL